jgi:alpha-tubulin suppressor-like RCC1 family protein
MANRLCELKKKGVAPYLCFPQKGALRRTLERVRRKITPTETNTSPSSGGIRGSIEVKRPNVMSMASVDSCRYAGVAAGASANGFTANSVFLDRSSTQPDGGSRGKDTGSSGSNICARVTLHLDQNAVLTRAAFVGTFQIDNDQPALPIQGVRLALDIRTLDDSSANDRFFTGAPELAGMTAIDGTGSIPPQTTGSARFLFIPETSAATNGPTDYAIGGTLRYLDPESGQEVVVPIFPALVTVYPDASLRLKYFQQHDVFSDDPTTEEIEPAEPFSLGLLVQNIGLGRARSFSITSAQPRIVDNQKGLLIDFQMIGSQVGTQAVASSLTVALGDIEPNRSQVARWDFISSLQGKFLEYSAEFQHADALGGLRTSLIESIEIHELTHIVQADRAGDDALIDFLANDVPDPESLPDTLHLSDGTTVIVNLAAGATVNGVPGPGHLEIGLTAQVNSGWTYLRVTNPGPDLRLVDVRRSDGRRIRLGSNAWITDRSFPAALTGVRREHLLHVMDYNSTGAYTLTYSPSANTPPVLAAVPDQTILELSTLTVTNRATDVDIPANTLTFSLVAAPSGATLDTVTGVLSWTPTHAQSPSTNLITVRVTDNGVPPLSDSKSFTVVVTAQSSAPTITAQPQSRTNLAGSTATFSVVAAGTEPLAYQWCFNGANLVGATGTNLTLASVQLTNAGNYTVVVTNAYGNATSQVAVLVVTSQTDLEAGLLAYYPFDADARDHSGHPEADLADFGATPAFTDLRACFAFAPGSYTYHSNFNLTRVPLSISLWFKLRTVQPVGTKLIGNWGFTQPDAYRGFRIEQGSPDYLDLAIGGLPAQNRYEHLQACEVGKWYHLVACFDTNGASAYVDGVLKRRVDMALAYRTQAPKMWLGGRGTPSDDWWGDLDGWLDEIRIYDRILQSEEILLLRQQTNFAPVITAHPQSRTNVAGTTAAWSVAALGTPPLTYQWRKNGDNLSDGGNVSGAATASLTLTSVQFPDAGSYSVVVANAAGNVTSQAALLTVIPPVPRTEGVVVAWGQNNWGQTDVPAGLSNVVAMAAGSMHNLALKNNGTVVGWGGADFGKTTPPAGLTNAVAVAAGDNHSLALKFDGTVVGWGNNGSGQTNPPPGLSDVVAIAAGYDHNLALTGNGLVVAWGGSPLFGQTNVPAGASNVVAISAGQYVSLALRGDGTIVAWGYSSSGEANIPANATNVVAISAGRFHCLALRGDGKVLAWGLNNYCQKNVPSGLSNVVAIAGGAYHSLALQANGTLVGWGWNQFGQTTIPAGFASSNVLAIAARGNHCLALMAVVPSGVAPSITGQPQSRTNIAGTTANFTVTASGTEPLSFQWLKNGTNLANGGNVAGANTPTLTVSNAQTADAGSYTVVVSNAFGSVTSAVATLTVTVPTPPRILVNDGSFGVVSNHFGFNVTGTAGQVVIVEGSTNLLNWQSLQTNTLGSGPFYFSDPATGAFRWRFYRVRLGP